MRRPVALGFAFALGTLLAALCGLALFANGHAVAAADLPDLPRPPIRETVAPPVGVAGTLPADPPALPDLTVRYISRTPRYAAYKVDYPGGIPTLRAGTDSAQRRPAAGEPVTLTAVIMNVGPAASAAADYQWTLDGGAVGAGSLPSLSAGEMVSVTITWQWEDAPHTFEITLDESGALTEISVANNRLDHQTDALFMAIDVHPYVYQEFARRPNLVGTWSFEDWVQAQIVQMNERLGQAVYPLTPAGVPDRVRIDQITVLPDDSVQITAADDDLPEFDGRWTFGVAEDDHHTPVDERHESAEKYAENYAGQIDWGLIHELTHQLGVIDLYRLGLDGAVGNPLTAFDGRPLLLGHHWPNPGLMGGGDTAPHNDGTYYSSHTARGLNSNTGYRRGYYGDYQFDLPADIMLRLSDNRGLPAAGAQVDVFQTNGDRLSPAPVFSGIADAAGLLALPNRPIPGGGVATATGHTLAPNPFGLIDVVGTNGLLLVRIRSPYAPAHEEYRWLALTDLNLAYWAGEAGSHTVTLQTWLPPPDAPPAPILAGEVTGSVVRLHWLPIDVGAATYRIYRGLQPEFQFEFLADTGAGLTHSDVMTTTAWYAVAAVDSAGRESAFSNVVRAPLLVRPVGLMVDAATHELIVLDQHSGGLFHRAADGDWIGRMGSQHLGLVGARGMSVGPGGYTALAAGGRRVVTLAGDRYLVSQFRIGTDDVHPDAEPAAVLLGGDIPTLDSPPADDARTLLLAPFDGSAQSGETAPIVDEGLAYVPGRFGEALRIGAGSRLAYASPGDGPLFLPETGGLEFWLRTGWPAADWVDHVFVDIGDGETYRFLIAKSAGAAMYVWVEDYDRHRSYAATDVRAWGADEWHHVAVTWNADRLDLSLDGRLQDTHYWRHAITGTVDAIWIGTDRDGQYPALADIDELRISDFARWDRTDAGRLIVANAGENLLQVFDLLGNAISSYGAGAGAIGPLETPIALAWLDPRRRDALLVAESGAGRVQRLHFDGQALGHPTVVADGFSAPAGIALGPDGSLLVSDMARDSVSQVDTWGQIMAEWTAPNDGHAGGFADPRGLAIAPDGSILVADGGNARVVAIEGVFPRVVYLPLLADAGPGF